MVNGNQTRKITKKIDVDGWRDIGNDYCKIIDKISQ